MRACILVFVLASFITACMPQSTAMPIIDNLPSTTEIITFIPSVTNTASPTVTNTTVPTTDTSIPVCDCTETPSPTKRPTKLPTGTAPGIMIHGIVTLPNEEGVAGAQVYYALSTYPGNPLATTNVAGQYDGFIYVPQDETVRVWVEYPGYVFKPGRGGKSWINNEFAWHHYAGYENIELSFIGTPE